MLTELIGFSQTYQWYAGQPLNILENGILGFIQFRFDPIRGLKKSLGFCFMVFLN